MLVALLAMLSLNAKADLRYTTTVAKANAYIASQMTSEKDAHNMLLELSKMKGNSELSGLTVPSDLGKYKFTAAYNTFKIERSNTIVASYVMDSEKVISRNGIKYTQGDKESRQKFFARILSDGKKTTSIWEHVINSAYANDDFDEATKGVEGLYLKSQDALVTAQTSDLNNLFEKQKPDTVKQILLGQFGPKSITCNSDSAIGKIKIQGQDFNFQATSSNVILTSGSRKITLSRAPQDAKVMTSGFTKFCGLVNKIPPEKYAKLLVGDKQELTNWYREVRIAFEPEIDLVYESFHAKYDSKTTPQQKLIVDNEVAESSAIYQIDEVKRYRIDVQKKFCESTHPKYVADLVTAQICENGVCKTKPVQSFVPFSGEFDSAQQTVLDKIKKLPYGDKIIKAASESLTYHLDPEELTAEKIDTSQMSGAQIVKATADMDKSLFTAKNFLNANFDKYSKGYREAFDMKSLFAVPSCCKSDSCRYSMALPDNGTNLVPTQGTSAPGTK
jgi:hypothetical protein